MMQLIDT